MKNILKRQKDIIRGKLILLERYPKYMTTANPNWGMQQFRNPSKNSLHAKQMSL